MIDPSRIPSIRIRTLTDHPPRADGDFVLYWMTAFRRPHYNYSLDRAIAWAEQLRKPLIVLEAIRVHYRWACDRFHRFLIDGMIDNQEAFRTTPVYYYPYVEPKPGSGSGLAEALSKRACVVISDDFPCFFHPAMYDRVVSKYSTRVELVDSNGMMPLRAADRTFTVAHSYRRFMQKTLPQHWNQLPAKKPFERVSLPPSSPPPQAILRRWPPTDLASFASRDASLASLPIDHEVGVSSCVGGFREANRRWTRFLSGKLEAYENDRNEPDLEGSSALSAHMHFGHLSVHQMFETLLHRVEWNEEMLSKPNGKVNGFWNAGPSAEALLDQLLTWREIGFNLCSRESNYDRYESLPHWAQETLEEHRTDRRPWIYSLEEFEESQTHDPLWNAAQRQLVQEGRIHNYLRMLWGKKILHWTPSPQAALDIMIHLNNKYALDGRDPNSYSGIFWVLGRYDRAWGPEREVFGKIRYMTSESTAKKWGVKKYLERFGTPSRR